MRRLTDLLDKMLLGLMLVSLVVYLVFFQFPSLAEIGFGQGIYVFVRWVFDHSFGLLPIAGIYVMTGGVLAVIIYILGQPGLTGIKLKRLGQVAAILLLMFFWFWGFNYARPDIKTKLDLEIPDVDSTILIRHFELLTDSLATWRDGLQRMNYSQIEKEVQSSVRRFLETEGLPAPGNPRVRRLLPSGVLLGTSTAGIFLPFSMEAHIDAGLHWLTWPHVMSHEMAHGFGVTDEGECNFIASISCRENKIPYFKYSGGLYDLRLIYSALIRIGTEEDQLKSMIPRICLSDLEEIRSKHDAYPNYVPEAWRNWIYDKYLKSQGVSSGLSSYGEVLGLLLAWEARNE